MSQNTALIAISTKYQFQDLEIGHSIVILSSGFLSKMTRKSNIETEEVFLFDKSLIVCHNKGKTGMFGLEDEYSFWIRFPMNTLEV